MSGSASAPLRERRSASDGMCGPPTAALTRARAGAATSTSGTWWSASARPRTASSSSAAATAGCRKARPPRPGAALPPSHALSGDAARADLCRLSGLRHVVSTDASATVVEAMRARAAARGCTDIAWEVADLLALPYADATFDIVIEKGVLDCFLVDQRSFWQLDEAAQARVATVLSECHRVLTPRGALLSITFAAPHLRRPLLQRGAFTWRCAHDTFGDEWAYYFYTLRKGRKQPHEADADEAAAAAALRPVLPPGECMTQEHMDDESFLMGAMLDAD